MIGGHVWTVAPYLLRGFRPPRPPPSRHFVARVPDPCYGEVPITGRLRTCPEHEGLAIIVHGLGGDAAAPYCVDAASAAEAENLAALRINLRGADRRGHDFYHAGLSDDLNALLAHPDVARFRAVYLLGYSLGGHLALRTAAMPHHPNLAGVAAVCPPIDLARGARSLDQPARALYRQKLLRNLKDVYREVARRRQLEETLPAVEKIGYIRDWDERIVAPRWGFASREDYYARATVEPHLDRIDVPAMVIAARRDPMVLAHTVRPALDRARMVRTLWVERAGHIGFPRHLDLGLGGAVGLARQLLGWLRASG